VYKRVAVSISAIGAVVLAQTRKSDFLASFMDIAPLYRQPSISIANALILAAHKRKMTVS